MSSSSRSVAEPSSPAAIALQRLWTQRLCGPRFESVADAVQTLTAVQSQDYAGARWALGQRTAGVTDADVDRLFSEGAILRTHVMRPTWHFVAPSDIAWLQELTASRVKAILAPYDRRLEIDAPLIRRAHAVIARALRDGEHLTRPEIASRLAKSGIIAAGQRLGHIVMHAELDGVIASGRLKGKQFTYALLAERAPHARRLKRDEALAELTARFFSSHGPAQLIDFAWWSGLTLTDGKRGVGLAGSSLISEVAEGKTYYWSSPSSTPPRGQGPAVHLLPNYDELLIAYRDRSALLHPDIQVEASGLIAHVLTVDGRVVGGWRRIPERGRLVVELGPIGRLGAREREALRLAARQLSKFAGLPVEVR